MSTVESLFRQPAVVTSACPVPLRSTLGKQVGVEILNKLSQLYTIVNVELNRNGKTHITSPLIILIVIEIMQMTSNHKT